MLFNEYGVCTDSDIQEAEDEISEIAERICKQLIGRGVPLGEIRAVASLLCGSITLAVSEAILRQALDMRRALRNESKAG